MTTATAKKPTAAKRKPPVDWGDAAGLVSYIEGHAGHASEAIAAKDRDKLLGQAIEIQAWASSLMDVANGIRR